MAFKKLFLDGEQDDEQAGSLAEILTELRSIYGTNSFKARVIVERCKAIDLNEVPFRTNLEAASGRAIQVATVQVISQRLRSCVDRPTRVGGEQLTLCYKSDHEGGRFLVEARTVKSGSEPESEPDDDCPF